MKVFTIFSLLAISILMCQNRDENSEILQYGFNYMGDIKDGKRHGTGKFIYQNGDTYDGEWVNDLKEGEGTYTYKNDSHTYIGSFLKNEFNGWGTLNIIGGGKYEGEWKSLIILTSLKLSLCVKW